MISSNLVLSLLPKNDTFEVWSISLISLRLISSHSIDESFPPGGFPLIYQLYFPVCSLLQFCWSVTVRELSLLVQATNKKKNVWKKFQYSSRQREAWRPSKKTYSGSHNYSWANETFLLAKKRRKLHEWIVLMSVLNVCMMP